MLLVSAERLRLTTCDEDNVKHIPSVHGILQHNPPRQARLVKPASQPARPTPPPAPVGHSGVDTSRQEHPQPANKQQQRMLNRSSARVTCSGSYPLNSRASTHDDETNHVARKALSTAAHLHTLPTLKLPTTTGFSSCFLHRSRLNKGTGHRRSEVSYLLGIFCNYPFHGFVFVIFVLLRHRHAVTITTSTHHQHLLLLLLLLL